MELLTDLKQAYDGSWFTILGAGGDLSDWESGVQEHLDEKEIGTVSKWYHFTGEQINRFAEHKAGGGILLEGDAFQPDLTCLAFPLEGLDVGKLAIFKLQTGSRWFDDIVDNMRVRSS